MISESATTRDDIGKVQYQLEQVQLSSKESELIESFAFDSMFTRQNSIHPAAHETFRWIFEENDDASWANFAEWMKSDGQMYWSRSKLKKKMFSVPSTDKAALQYSENQVQGRQP